MKKQTKEKKAPTHGVYVVQGEGDKARWSRVGAAWLHGDKKGANLKFDSIPLNGRVVVREITEQDNASGEYNAAAGEGGAQ